MNVGGDASPACDSVKAGTQIVGNVSAVQLPASPAGIAYLKAAAGNTGKITVGGASVAAGAGLVLAAGETSGPLYLQSLTALYAIADAAAQTLEYLVTY